MLELRRACPELLLTFGIFGSRLLKENRQRMKATPATLFAAREVEAPGYFEPEPAEPSCSPAATNQKGVPVFVMLPLDTVWVIERDGRKISILKKEKSLEIALHTLKQAGVEGVMVDVWWGLVERAGPRSYDFSAYHSLFRKIARAGLKVQAVMSFHAAGGNVGDTCKIPLPRWILDIGDKDPDIYYTDKSGHRNRECLSLGCDESPIFWGRTPVEMYGDFIEAFAQTFHPLFGEHAGPSPTRMQSMLECVHAAHMQPCTHAHAKPCTFCLVPAPMRMRMHGHIRPHANLMAKVTPPLFAQAPFSPRSRWVWALPASCGTPPTRRATGAGASPASASSSAMTSTCWPT